MRGTTARRGQRARAHLRCNLREASAHAVAVRHVGCFAHCGGRFGQVSPVCAHRSSRHPPRICHCCSRKRSLNSTPCLIPRLWGLAAFSPGGWCAVRLLQLRPAPGPGACSGWKPLPSLPKHTSLSLVFVLGICPWYFPVLLAVGSPCRELPRDAPRPPVAVSVMVRQKIGKEQMTIPWTMDNDAHLQSRLVGGQLLETNEGGTILRSIFRLQDLKEGGTYVFVSNDKVMSGTIIHNLASAHEVESTLSIVKDPSLCAAFGPLVPFNQGEPFLFKYHATKLIEADGIALGRGYVLLNSAKLAAQREHFRNLLADCLLLQSILSGKQRLSNFPEALAGHRWANVVPILSANHFPHRLQLEAVELGIIPLSPCEGGRFGLAAHVPPLPFAGHLARSPGEGSGMPD